MLICLNIQNFRFNSIWLIREYDKLYSWKVFKFRRGFYVTIGKPITSIQTNKTDVHHKWVPNFKYFLFFFFCGNANCKQSYTHIQTHSQNTQKVEQNPVTEWMAKHTLREKSIYIENEYCILYAQNPYITLNRCTWCGKLPAISFLSQVNICHLRSILNVCGSFTLSFWLLFCYFFSHSFISFHLVLTATLFSWTCFFHSFIFLLPRRF